MSQRLTCIENPCSNMWTVAQPGGRCGDIYGGVNLLPFEEAKLLLIVPCESLTNYV